jgi:hypothetical protein
MTFYHSSKISAQRTSLFKGGEYVIERPKITQKAPEGSGRFRKVTEHAGTFENILELILLIIAYIYFSLSYIYSSNYHFRVT